MSISPEFLSTLYVADTTLQGLLRLWQTEIDSEKSERIKQAIIVIVEMHERSSFLARFTLKDFDTWNKVLTKEESDSSKAHKAEFYEPHLIEVLKKNGGKLDPIKAIQQILERVINQLTLADFALTASKRFRYDTTIRFLADALKKRGILSDSKESKNKYWLLVKLPEPE
jgi:hypothetical protein